jgi:hypothetical protein
MQEPWSIPLLHPIIVAGAWIQSRCDHRKLAKRPADLGLDVTSLNCLVPESAQLQDGDCVVHEIIDFGCPNKMHEINI